MVCIQHKLQQSVGMFLSTKQIRDHLKTLYDLDSLVSSPFVWMCTSLILNLTIVMKLYHLNQKSFLQLFTMYHYSHSNLNSSCLVVSIVCLGENCKELH